MTRISFADGVHGESADRGDGEVISFGVVVVWHDSHGVSKKGTRYYLEARVI